MFILKYIVNVRVIREDSITFADQIQQVDTTGVEPLITVLEDRPLETRKDIVTEVQLQTLMFVSPSTSSQYFYNWQRQRRIWWRKFSASPGRYALTDIQTSPSGEQRIEITSTYPWGSHVIETIHLNPNGHQSLNNDQLLMKDGRKRVHAHCISSITHLSTMVLNTLCDAYDDPVFQDVSRPLLRFHRKIAPYKISFAISTSNAANTEELNELALYLCKQLRVNNVSVLLLPTASRISLDSQWCQYDQLGIPYSILLNDSTLKNGIANLRSRDTKLKEQVHISDLSNYVDQLFKNY
ncbi:DNA polymerase gamma subunit 2 [Carabus blaptoides fortunei]